MEEDNQCPNGHGELETVWERIPTRDGRTYFNVTIKYCPECLYISEVDADL